MFSIVGCSTGGQEEPLDLQSPETKTCLLQKLYALKEEHQMYESDNSKDDEGEAYFEEESGK